MKKLLFIFISIVPITSIFCQVQPSIINNANSVIDSTTFQRTGIGTIIVTTRKGNALYDEASYKIRFSRFGNIQNGGSIALLMHQDASGNMKVSPKDSLKVTPQMLQGTVTINKGGTGLTSAGSNGQVLISNGFGFIMSTLPNYLISESDPVWLLDKTDYYTKAQADGRYLQSFTEVDGSTVNELQSLSISAGTIRLTLDGNIHLPDSSTSNEIQTLGGSNRTITLTNGGSFTTRKENFDSLDNRPTTLAGYGITNGQVQLNGAGFIKASGTIISYDNNTYLTAEIDGSTTNELQTIATVPGLQDSIDARLRTGALVPYLLSSTAAGAYQPLLGFTAVPNARSITINGIALDLTANRTWSVGTLVASDTIFLHNKILTIPSATTNLVEGTNLYFTTSRARASFSAGTGISINGSGVISATGGTGTVTSITASSPLTGGIITTSGSIGIQNGSANSTTKGAVTFDSIYFNDNGSGNIALGINYGTAAVASNAVTINQPRGRITIAANLVLAGATFSITFTNSYITSTSTVSIQAGGGGSLLNVPIQAYVRSQTSGSCVINLVNLNLLNILTTGSVVDFIIFN